MEHVVLTADRIELSVPATADIDAITAACQDPEVQRWTTVPSPYSRADAESFVEGYCEAGWVSGRYLTWGIRAPGGFAEMVALDAIGQGHALIGYWMTSAYRGHGLMTAAVRTVLAFGFAPEPEGLALTRIEWHANAGNRASASVARAAGFRFEGVRRSAILGRQGYEDDWMAGVLATDDRAPVAWPVLA